MKANPKTVWVMLNNHEPYYVDKKESFSLTEGWSCVPYHLHPGDEVARALNIIRGDVWYYNLNTTDKDVAEDLRNNGIPIRWDAKKGRFV